MYNYLYEDIPHTDTSTEYLKKLGMGEESIESLQRDARESAQAQMSTLRTQRDLLLYSIEWRLTRNTREVLLGKSPKDSPKVIQSIHEYMEELADIPKHYSHIDNVVWPIKP